MNKQTAIASVNEMPQEFELDELIERLVLMEKIEKGRKDVKEGKTYTHEEAKAKLGKWIN
jgi:predicted transcriptional regulator